MAKAKSNVDKARAAAVKALDERYHDALESMFDALADDSTDNVRVRRSYNFGVPGNAEVNSILDKFEVER